VPSVNLGFAVIDWVDWWTVLLGLSFVAVTLLAPKGIGGIFDLLAKVRTPDRKGAALGPDDGALMEREGRE
jgi:urea transport system permease protein